MQVSSAEVQSKVPDRAHLYSSLLRNQLFVPKLKDSIMTVAFMRGLIGYEVYWAPLCSDIRIRNCADIPSKQEIAIELTTAMRDYPTNDPSIERQF